MSAAGDRGPRVPEDRQDDERRRDQLAAVHDRHPRVRQKQVTRRHRQARNRPVEMSPADEHQPCDKPAVGKNREYPGNDDLSWLLFERGWQPRLDRLLHLGGFFASFPEGRGRPILRCGGLSRIACGAVVDGQADRLGQQQGQDSDRQAEQARSAKVRLQQRAAGQAQIKQATDQPCPRSQEQPDEGQPGRPRLAAPDQHHAGHKHEQEQQVQVSHTPEPAELEEERDAAQQ